MTGSPLPAKAVEFVVLGRVLLVGLLEERNYVLARNIRKACFNAKPGGTLVAEARTASPSADKARWV